MIFRSVPSYSETLHEKALSPNISYPSACPLIIGTTLAVIVSIVALGALTGLAAPALLALGFTINAIGSGAGVLTVIAAMTCIFLGIFKREATKRKTEEKQVDICWSRALKLSKSAEPKDLQEADKLLNQAIKLDFLIAKNKAKQKLSQKKPAKQRLRQERWATQQIVSQKSICIHVICSNLEQFTAILSPGLEKSLENNTLLLTIFKLNNIKKNKPLSDEDLFKKVIELVFLCEKTSSKYSIIFTEILLLIQIPKGKESAFISHFIRTQSPQSCLAFCSFLLLVGACSRDFWSSPIGHEPSLLEQARSRGYEDFAKKIEEDITRAGPQQRQEDFAKKIEEDIAIAESMDKSTGELTVTSKH